MAQPQLKLSYFDLKLHAELSRMIFNYGGIAFTDHRIARTDFVKLKPTLPFGQVPVLELDGTIYAQSMAIARYAAKIVGPYPNDALEALKVDVFSCALCDLEDHFIDFMFKTSDDPEEEGVYRRDVAQVPRLAGEDGGGQVHPGRRTVAEPKIAAYLSKQ
ncbi:Thioredoxin-like fold [Phytophthora cactorum]|nr:Thioredoxin-like fold [Phytophthora cactorum]